VVTLSQNFGARPSRAFYVAQWPVSTVHTGPWGGA
jgi:hypothetical protein